jgi:predicted RNase H-like nuclease (RuvC/YqgF family)
MSNQDGLNEKDIQHLANTLTNLIVELGRSRRKIEDLERELTDLRKLHEPKGEEN